MKMLLNLIYFLIGFYILICFLLYFFQERIIFFPQKLDIDHTFNFNGDFEEKFFQTDDETTIHALHFFSKNPKGVILYFHGNAGSLEDWGEVADDFVKLDYDVLISDFRGYGKSTGQISEVGFYLDSQILFDFLKENYDLSKIIIYGRSLGTGVATDLASKNIAKQLILETPFSNFAKLAQSRFGIFPVKLLLKFQFNNEEKFSKIKYPIHIIHGTHDEIIPYENAIQLKSILNENSSFTTVENGGHNNLFTFQKYWTTIKVILK